MINIDSLYKKCCRLCWLAIVLAVLALMSISVLQLQNLVDGTQHAPIIEHYAILLTLIAIPSSLKLFRSTVDKLKQQGENILTKYFCLFALRLGVLLAVFAFNVVSLGVLGVRSFLYLSVILLIALFFVFPDRADFGRTQNQKQTAE